MIIFNATLSARSRASIARLQSELATAQDELSSGRRADIGKALGSRSIVAAQLRGQIGKSQAILDANRVASARLDATQVALGSLTSLAQSMQQKVLGAGAGTVDAGTLTEEARAAIDQAISIVNSTFDGAYLFTGLGAGKALNLFAGGPAAAINAAFQAKFGANPGDAANGAISSDQMQSFLDTEFSGLFDDANWTSVWSNASDASPEARISETISIENSTTANEQGIRDLLGALTMVAGLGLQSLDARTAQTVVASAAAKLGGALSELATMQAETGIKQNMIDDASNEVTSRQVAFKGRLDEFESVDPAEVSVRISTLSAQLQASYQVTSKLAQLSLVNFV